MSTAAPQVRMRNEDFPAVFQNADRRSTEAQKRFLTLTAVVLGLMTVAAAMGVVSAPWSGWVGAGAFALAIVIGALAVTQDLERAWYDGRALAESTKSIAWLYVARGGPWTAPADPDALLKARVDALQEELAQIDFKLPAGGHAISDRMAELRAESLDERRKLYLRERLQDQIGWYRRRGAEHGRYAKRFRVATLVAQAAGLAGAVLKAIELVDVDLLGLGAATAVALTAWLQARDHVTLARVYELTAADIERVIEDAHRGEDERAWGDFVEDAETALSREHVMWQARRGRR